MNFRAIALVLAIMVALPAVVVAEDNESNDKPIVSLTPYLGGGMWSDDVGLDDSFLFGGRLAFHVNRWLGVEGTYGRSSTDVTDGDGSVDVDHYGLDLFADLLPSKRFNPYLTAGWGQLDLDGGDALGENPLNGWEAGAGVKIRLGGDDASHRNLRLEIRDVMTDMDETFLSEGGTAHNLIMTAGLQFAFGKSHKDSDGDGVEDGRDACGDTPAGAMVDENGCPVDSDGDGVFDGLDMCDGTPAGAEVDASGCPVDSDGDGVFDGLDQCPDTDTTLAVDDKGCPIPVVSTMTQSLDPLAVTSESVRFETESALIRPEFHTALDAVGETMVEWPSLRLEVEGHADDTGSMPFNQTLSEERAAAVKAYLVERFPSIEAGRISTVGYGEMQPVADNGTESGRSANRRAAFNVLNTDDLTREVEVREMQLR